MNEVIAKVEEQLIKENLTFKSKPILIGGMAMEYYGIRKSGADIDLVITGEDYEQLAGIYPDKRKDIYGDLGVTPGIFEIWRSIALLDYEFFLKEAIEEERVYVISIDRLLWSRVCAMEVEKYRKDLELIKAYFYEQYRNPMYHAEALTHVRTYEKNHGVVFGGKYED